MWKNLFQAVVLGCLLAASAVDIARGQNAGFSQYVDQVGGIALPDPKIVRAEWAHLGTWAVQGNDGVSEFHTVYTQRDTVSGYQKTGRFPDGAVLVKEVRMAASGTMTTGDVSWNSNEVLWFVMVKDTKDRFPDNPIWANQWGWGLFRASDPAKNVATDFSVDCMSCHLPARDTDWVYTQGYRVLGD